MIIRRMAHQLALPVTIVPAETVRAQDGLALSSRNGYLNLEERVEAPYLYQLLGEIQDQLHNTKDLTEVIIQSFEQKAMNALKQRGWNPDYTAIRLQNNLDKPNQENLSKKDPLVMLAAAKLGKTRLIDNLEI
jgi:pantoate--beta-alanine ligase